MRSAIVRILMQLHERRKHGPVAAIFVGPDVLAELESFLQRNGADAGQMQISGAPVRTGDFPADYIGFSDPPAS